LRHRLAIILGHHLIVKPRITQCGVGVLVAQERLHRHQRRTGVEQQRRKAVAQLVRCDVYPAARTIGMEPSPTIVGAQRAVAVDENVRGRCRAAHIQVCSERRDSVGTQANAAILQAFGLVDVNLTLS